MFCERNQPILTKKIDEQYPISSLFETNTKGKDKDKDESKKEKRMVSIQEEWLARDYPQRNIVKKKLLYSEGLIAIDSNF